jgi:hypothetical protein
MTFSILHISDLHRDQNDEIPNDWLLQSLERDLEQYSKQSPSIMLPALCIVSGDLVLGVNPSTKDPEQELLRQYNQAEEFLIGLADRFFSGNRGRVVILPGNHDICSFETKKSMEKIDIPDENENKTKLVSELYRNGSLLRWSWQDMCFYKIINEEQYLKRFRYFSESYERFYSGKRKYSLSPEQQFDIFDFDDIGFSLVTLNSCYNSDMYRRSGEFNPTTLSKACKVIKHPSRVGWLKAAAWHHNTYAPPMLDNYIDSAYMQLLIDAGVSIGFHGHQHISECSIEHYTLGSNQRNMAIVSASTLCAGFRNLRAGVPRSYNIVEIDTVAWTGRVHQRQMVNTLTSLPTWGAGHFINTGKPYKDFDLCKPPEIRPVYLDTQLLLEQSDSLLGTHQWDKAAEILLKIKDVPIARHLFLKACEESGNIHWIMESIWPPQTDAEAAIIGAVIFEKGTQQDCIIFSTSDFIRQSKDASVHDISRRIERRLK